MKSIQLLNIESSKKRMDEAKENNDEHAFNIAKEELNVTLEAIKNSDRKTYSEFHELLNEYFQHKNT